MMREFTVPAQPASDECPKVPRTVKVFAESKVDALKKLSAALTDDPTLSQPHPELTDGAEKFEEQVKESKTKKPKK